MKTKNDLKIEENFSWLDRDIRRFKELGCLIPAIQRRVYEKIGQEWCTGRTVIDLGCSIGIGSNILSHWSRHVWGVDKNEEAIKFATLAFTRPNMSFAVMDVEKMPTRELARFEVILAIEVLEHLKDFQAGLNTIKRLFSLKGNSMGFITAPNIANEEIKKRDAENKLHHHHWTAGEFYKIMTDNFQAVVFFAGEKLERWLPNEQTDGNSKDQLIVAKVEGVK